jgi:hypothetical protein
MWHETDRQMTLKLELNDETNNTSSTFVLTGTLSNSDQPSNVFLKSLESSEWTGPLLYGELLPRELDWASRIERLLPSGKTGRIPVPVVTDAEIQIDGMLDEDVWTASYYDTEGRIGKAVPLSAGDESHVWIRHVPGFVVLGLRFPDHPDPPSFAIATQPDLTVPNSLSRHYRVTFRGETAVSATCSVGGKETPWEFDWEHQAHNEAQTWDFEVAIPASFENDRALPKWKMRVGALAAKSSVGNRWQDDAILDFKQPTKSVDE